MTEIDREVDLVMILEVLRETTRGPYILRVSSATLNKAGYETSEGEYGVCSACYSIIDKTWDHKDWCELYEDEELAKWLKKGKNEK